MASDVGSRQRPIFRLRALSVVAGELTLGAILRCGRYITLAALFHFLSTPDHCDSRILLAIVDELVLGTIRHCGRSRILAARLRFGFAADLELSHVRLFYIYGGRGLEFLLLFWARAVVVLSALSTLQTLWSSVLVLTSRCRLEAQLLSSHQLRITAR